MKNKKLKKWLAARNEMIISNSHIDRIIPFVSDKKIDLQTAKDLLLRDYYNSIDSALTTPGRNLLYALLRAPLSDKKRIISRRNFISGLSENKTLSERLDNLLWKVRFSPAHSSDAVLFDNEECLFTKEKLFFLLLIFFFLVIAVPLLYSQFAFFSILAFLLLSFIMFARNQSIYNTYIPGLIIIAAHFRTAEKIIKLYRSLNISNEYIDNLAVTLPDVKKIMPSLNILRSGSLNASDPLQLLLFWIKNLFCLDLLAYNRAISVLNKNREAFIRFYCRYGIIDALSAVSKIVINNDTICEPQFHREGTFSADHIYHPLIPDAVDNSVIIKGSMILTGSNMAGKSTFLRTIGLNVVLAQTTGYCHAQKISLPFMNIVSIINKHDNLHSGESFYFYEAKRITEMINKNSKARYLFLIDELLSGTNSLERINASIAIIKYLIKTRNITSVIATHDISIAENLKHKCKCFYFSDIIENNEMKFNYKLKQGIINTTNAIKMLEILGLPSDIIDDAGVLIAEDRIT